MSKETKQITDRQMSILSALYILGFKWITKDEDNSMYAYSTKPIKDEVRWDFNINKYGNFEYDDKKIFGVCNSCEKDIYECKEDYIKKELNTNVWK